jgi:YebC/PmpR family DNA-binding regulatory protein
MGAQWKHGPRTANAAKRGAMISKLIKEITVAAKNGSPDPDSNPRLRAAVEAAKKQSVPRDNIDRALKRAQGIGEGPVNYETIIYEGFAPHKVAVIVECVTENKNRTASDVRVLFRKGQLGAPGSVGYMFEHTGVVEASHKDKSLDIESVAIEAGAQNVEPLTAQETPEGELGARFFCDRADLDTVSKFLVKSEWTVTQADMSYIAKNMVELSEDQQKEVAEFLSALDDHDDVHRVYAAMK